MNHRYQKSFSIVFLILLGAMAIGAEPALGKKMDFIHEIQPILRDSCYECHGAKKQKAGLRLDSKTDALKGSKEGPVIIPGNAEKSPLYQRLVTTDADDRMPAEAPPLATEKIAKLRAWIDQGAVWPDSVAVAADPSRHWAFQPIQRVSTPKARDAKWARNDIDRFILAKLAEKKLQPSPIADRRVLIRRVTFDLIGLPPAPEEIEAFVADKSPDAYEKLVDRLLASPQFGERWARHWLDAARFGESHGFEQDYDRPNAYWYRDFVIRAFNADMPYDQFVKWNLAGDEFAPNDPWAMAATGFLGACVFPTQLTEAEFEPARYDELDDMAKTTGVAMLGLTIGCARCHDHKYDPISNKEYYGLAAAFTTTIRSEIDLDFDPEKSKVARAKWESERSSLVAAREKFEREQLASRFDQWLKAPRKEDLPEPRWVLLDVMEAKSGGGATLIKQNDLSLLATGKNPDFDTYTVVAHTSLKNITGVRVEALAHPSFVKSGPGRADNGNIDLTDFHVTAAPADGKGEAVSLKFKNPRATFNQGKNLSIELAIDADKKSGWALDPQFGKDHAASFELETPLAGYEGGTKLVVTLDFQGNTRHNIGRPRLSVSTEEPPLRPKGDAVPQATIEAIQLVAGGNSGQLTAVQRANLLVWYRGIDPEWQKLNEAVVSHDKNEPRSEKKKVMVTSEGFKPMKHHADDRGFSHFYPKTYVLKRGDPKQKVEEASPGFLQILNRAPATENRWFEATPPGSRTSYRRRSLANWITDTQYGAGDLLARNIVNRLWHHHFGRGIVGTPNDFGLAGERPTHPELLDWLATELKTHGWSLKRIHKLIVTSAAYMQRSDGAQDSNAPLLQHFPRRRLEAEAIRDAMLAVSGQLDATMFGPGTLDQGMKRRSIYFFQKRSQLIPVMQLFDAPETTVSIGARVNTTIAPQALTLMNSPHVRGYARSFAARVTGNNRSPITDYRLPISHAYTLALSRPATTTEMETAVAFHQTQTAAYTADKKNDAAMLALTDFCQVLLSMNEFIYVE